MSDKIRKMETILSIKKLQLSSNLITALEDEVQAEYVAHAIDELIQFSELWN